MSKKKRKTTDEITNGFEKFIKGKETNPNNGDLFEALLKKAATTPPTKKESKQRGSK